jgi:hypothetical protein
MNDKTKHLNFKSLSLFCDLIEIMIYKLLGGLLVSWYVVPWAAAVHQEFKLGWPKWDLSSRIKIGVMFMCMELAGTYQQLYVFGYRILFGVHESRMYNHRLMEKYYGWLIPYLFGPMICEGAENIPK